MTAARSLDPTSEAAREQAATALARALLAVLAVPATAASAAPDRLVTRRTSGLPPKTFDHLVKDGTLPAAKLGREWFVKYSDVLALIDRMQAVRDPAPAVEPADDANDPTTIVGALARANARRQRRAELAAARTPSSRR